MTGKDIYGLALQLIACGNTDGTDHPDSEDFKARAVSIINILIAENHKLDRSLRGDNQARLCVIKSLDDTVHCHELIMYGIIPYGLASLLIAEEDGDLARALYDRYLTNLKSTKEGVTAVVHSISDCYGFYG